MRLLYLSVPLVAVLIIATTIHTLRALDDAIGEACDALG